MLNLMMFPENQLTILKAKSKSKNKKSLKYLAPIWDFVISMEKGTGITKPSHLSKSKFNPAYQDPIPSTEKIKFYLKEDISHWHKMLKLNWKKSKEKMQN